MANSAHIKRPRTYLDSGHSMAPDFKSAYLIHGDDHGRITERRARLRELAEQQSGANGFELFEGRTRHRTPSPRRSTR